MKHIWETHDHCEISHCPICEGGLANCIVCTAAECQLPDECPGVPMTAQQKDQVCSGVLNFHDGIWEMPIGEANLGRLFP
jgi:hypothetical protein